MIAVVQRVRSASVAIDGQIIGHIGTGLCVLAAIVETDTDAELLWLAKKIVTLRAFPEGELAYHVDVTQIGGGLLLVSNFTVAANASTGRRPGFSRAMKPDAAGPMFARFVAYVRQLHADVQTGRFGADMVVSVENDGPLTLILESPAVAAVTR